MSPEDATVFEELRERAFRSGANCVSTGTEYYGSTRDTRFFVTFESNGWHRSYYGKTLREVFRSVGIFLDERGIE